MGQAQEGVSEILRQAWGLAAVHREEAYRMGLASAELQLIAQHDFTPYVRARRWPLRFLQAAHKLMRWLPHKMRAVLQIYLGGLALETLYAAQQMRYQVWIAKE